MSALNLVKLISSIIILTLLMGCEYKQTKSPSNDIESLSPNHTKQRSISSNSDMSKTKQESIQKARNSLPSDEDISDSVINESKEFVGTYAVISFDGVNLRSKPTKASKIEARIPYRASIEVIENESYGKEHYKDCTFYRDGNQYDISIDGYWVKAIYKNVEGYVFNSFIYQYAKSLSVSDYKRFEGDLIHWNKYNDNYVLLLPKSFCTLNLPLNPNINWYGIYQFHNAYKLKSVDLSIYHTTYKKDNYRDLVYSTNNNENLKFIFGSFKKLDEREIQGLYNIGGSPTVDNFFDYKLDENGVLDFKALALLNASEPQSYKDIIVNWQGDIDHDGEFDYVISSSCCGEFVHTYLYLSSEFDGDSMKPVSVFGSGYCC